MKMIMITAVLTFAAAAVGAEQAIPENAFYLDPAQPIEKRVADLISRMTLEEKATALFHNARANERLRIPAWGGWNQCLHGVWSKRPTTCFPVSIAMAATWDPALICSVADAISDEAHALYNIGASGPRGKHGLVYRAPVINISRDRLCDKNRPNKGRSGGRAIGTQTHYRPRYPLKRGVQRVDNLVGTFHILLFALSSRGTIRYLS